MSWHPFDIPFTNHLKMDIFRVVVRNGVVEQGDFISCAKKEMGEEVVLIRTVGLV